MNWLNLETRVLNAPEYIGSEPVARATWLSVLLWCAMQENGGRIVGAIAWKDRQWQQTCGVMCAEIDAAPLLLKWEASDLIVWLYPAEKEIEVQARRKSAAEANFRRWKARVSPSSESVVKSVNRSDVGSVIGSINAPSTESGREGEGEEKRREEKENTGTPNVAPAPAVSTREPSLSLSLESSKIPKPPNPTPKPACRPRERNELLDALASVDGSNVEQVTPGAWSGIAKALADIKTATPGVTPAEIHRRARIYRQKNRDWTLTAASLSKHWGACDHLGGYKAPPLAQKPALNEPAGWKAYLDANFPTSRFSVGGNDEAQKWGDLPSDIQALIIKGMQKP